MLKLPLSFLCEDFRMESGTVLSVQSNYKCPTLGATRNIQTKLDLNSQPVQKKKHSVMLLKTVQEK